MKRGKGVVVLLLILASLGFLGWYGYTIVDNTREGQANAGQESDGVKLGLDLSGGVSVTYTIDDDNPSQSDVNDTVAQLEQRASSYTTEYSVYTVGAKRITVEIPGVYDADAVLADLGSPGSLYFIAHKNADGEENYSYNSSTGQYELAEGKTIEGLIEDGSVILDGTGVKAADAAYNGDKNSTTGSEPVVELKFNDEATEKWAAATEAAYNDSNDSIGVYYDGQFISCPSVSAIITNGDCVINGMGSYEEAQHLATFIRVGSMKLTLSVLESSSVGATLGGDALSSAVKAAIIGLILVMLFMIFMYRLPGFAASIALGIYTTGVVALIYLFEITLTLPGIAGVILGIGMAVDANVITFARIREEIANGKSVSSSITEGYKKAFSAILDGNVTTFIAAFVLMILGSGTVKGFAYTLMISILVSMFTALVVARLLMQSFCALGLTNEKLYGRAIERKTINFMKHRLIYFIISLVIIVAGFVGMGVNSAAGNKSLNFSLEFMGGTSTSADMGKEYTVEQLESDVVPVLAEATGLSAAEFQPTKENNSTKVVFKSTALSTEQQNALDDTLVDTFGVDQTTIETQTISSTISNEMRRDAILAVVVACIFMLLYIWFRFKDIRFASSAIFALVHDVLIVLTAYALIRISVGNTFIACMLTIVGYSVNDTIVIFDRIRENLHGVAHKNPEDLAEVANKSLTQTLSRSINTSITTIIMVTLLYILGVSSIREFALPLLVGMICGSYSSIFIATELWYEMKLHLGRGRLIKK